jgi:hypothetical protein
MLTSLRVAILRISAVSVICLLAAAPVAAQDESALKSFFEGKRVTLKIDMPGTSDGVDVKVDAKQRINYKDEEHNLKSYGAAILTGDTVPVTLVKVKKDHIEFQLAGGGYGTFGDDTSTGVSLPDVERSEQERELEKLVRNETDSERRHHLERELDELRDRRERENRRIAIERERLEEEKRARLAERRLRGGSRFNVRYDDRVPTDIGPLDVVAALREYVDFGELDPISSGRRDAAIAAPPGDINQVSKGMTRAEVERVLGRPADLSERREGGLVITTLMFSVGDRRITADFVEDVLVRYAITSR